MSKLRVCFGPKTVVVDVGSLSGVPVPEKTDSYVPLRHDEFYDMVVKHLAAHGAEVVETVHALWSGGQRYFALAEIRHPSLASEDMSLVVALRNSYDKSLPAAIAAGNAVFVCDNLVLASEIVVGRKHTKNMFDNLEDRIELALKVLEAHWGDHFRRVAAYQRYDLTNKMAHDLIVEAYRQGAIAKVGVADVVDQWYNPVHNEFAPRTLWSLHNAFTEVWKGRADLLADRSAALHQLFDALIQFTATDIKAIIENGDTGYAGLKAYSTVGR